MLIGEHNNSDNQILPSFQITVKENDNVPSRFFSWKQLLRPFKNVWNNNMKTSLQVLANEKCVYHFPEISIRQTPTTAYMFEQVMMNTFEMNGK